MSTATGALPLAISCATWARSFGGTSVAGGISSRDSWKGIQRLNLLFSDMWPGYVSYFLSVVARGGSKGNCSASEYNRTSHRAHPLATVSRVSGAPHSLQNHPRRSPVHLRHSTGGLRRRRFGQLFALLDCRGHVGDSAGQRSGQPLLPRRVGTRF